MKRVTTKATLGASSVSGPTITKRADKSVSKPWRCIPKPSIATACLSEIKKKVNMRATHRAIKVSLRIQTRTKWPFRDTCPPTIVGKSRTNRANLLIKTPIFTSSKKTKGRIHLRTCSRRKILLRPCKTPLPMDHLKVLE